MLPCSSCGCMPTRATGRHARRSRLSALGSATINPSNFARSYPSTTYINFGSSPFLGAFQKWDGWGYSAELWRCSSLTETSAGLIIIPQNADGSFIYGGTPSDQSIVECIADLKARGLRVVFYPFVLLTSFGKPWRRRVAYFSADLLAVATGAVNGLPRRRAHI